MIWGPLPGPYPLPTSSLKEPSPDLPKVAIAPNSPLIPYIYHHLYLLSLAYLLACVQSVSLTRENLTGRDLVGRG